MADADLVESQPHDFDCDDCEFRRHVEALDPESLYAWNVYTELSSHRWVWDWQAGPWLLDRAIPKDGDPWLLRRISVIYDTLHPPNAKGNQ